MIDDLIRYKVSSSEISEIDHCEMSFIYYKLTETEGSEVARGTDFAQIEAAFWKALEPSSIIDIPYDPHESLDDQEICKFFFDLVKWDLEDTILNQMFWQFCRFQTERFSLMEKNEDYLLEYFLPQECEFELEGSNLIGRPDTIFLIPGTEEHYYIQDTKTSLDSPTWLDMTEKVPVLKKTNRYRAIVKQITVYYIIKKEHGKLIDGGNILHICPFMYRSEPFEFHTKTIRNILTVKIQKVRAALRIMRDNLTAADDPQQLKSTAKMLMKKEPNPWKCNRCSRNPYCIIAAF